MQGPLAWSCAAAAGKEKNSQYILYAGRSHGTEEKDFFFWVLAKKNDLPRQDEILMSKRIWLGNMLGLKETHIFYQEITSQ